uniref:Uncharacterized protein n=1 Tax=Magnetococcus massalia (strain MO-1) TaxID=451514 RepID=A0A1S7LKQ9_MAGMO|nr:protein of unknown function [Candidatus Magnetococcus massalia]
MFYDVFRGVKIVLGMGGAKMVLRECVPLEWQRIRLAAIRQTTPTHHHGRCDICSDILQAGSQ